MSEELMAVIREVHSQQADDVCWMDIDRIFAAAGLPVPDRTVGDKVAMLANCKRFIDTMCCGGHWHSFAELRSDLAAANERIRTMGESCDRRGRRIEHLEREIDQMNVNLEIVNRHKKPIG